MVAQRTRFFFFVRSQKESSTTTGHGGPSTSQKIQVPDKVDLTSPIPKGGTEKEQERGRLGEVVAVIHDLSEIVKSLPPFLPITLEEMMKQGKEDNAVCLLSSVAHKSLIQQSYVPFLFDALDRRCKGDGKFLFWVADSHSKEGMKVQSKYGVAVGQTTLLVMVPSHIPQCVEIFDESNLDERKLGEALAQALVQCQDLKEKSDTLKTRRALVTEQDQEFSEQCAEQKKGNKKQKECQLWKSVQNKNKRKKRSGRLSMLLSRQIVTQRYV